MSQDDEQVIQMVLTGRKKKKSHTASLNGISNALSPNKIASKPEKATKVIKVSIVEVNKKSK